MNEIIITKQAICDALLQWLCDGVRQGRLRHVSRSLVVHLV